MSAFAGCGHGALHASAMQKLISARRYDQIRFRFHTAWANSRPSALQNEIVERLFRESR
jgi:hypothetical protein